MPQTKIVFFDIDGTLIDMQAKKITPKMLETLHRLQESRHQNLHRHRALPHGAAQNRRGCV